MKFSRLQPNHPLLYYLPSLLLLKGRKANFIIIVCTYNFHMCITYKIQCYIYTGRKSIAVKSIKGTRGLVWRGESLCQRGISCLSRVQFVRFVFTRMMAYKVLHSAERAPFKVCQRFFFLSVFFFFFLHCNLSVYSNNTLMQVVWVNKRTTCAFFYYR